MSSEARTARKFSFLDFELDPSTGELRREGEELFLQEQPFRILKLLLERPGQVVGREELRKALWPNRPFVDSDHGINVAVSKLREDLGDSARAPRLIQTLTGRGYRFIAPVAIHERFRSLAVLPFANLSGDPKRQYLADGLTMAIIGRLGMIGDLQVISWQSVVQFNDTQEALSEIALLLNVDALVVGGVMWEDSRMRIEVELVAADPEHVLWAESFDLAADELLAVQRELARTVAREIEVVVKPDERTRLDRPEDVSPAAYDAYLKGLYHWSRFSEPDLMQAVEDFKRAIALAPDFAAAHSGIADTWLMIAFYGYRAPLEVFPEAEAAARRALELVPDSDVALNSMGALQDLYRRRPGDARVLLQRAIELNPSNSLARNWYSWMLAEDERHEDALEQIREAQRVDPLNVVVATVVGVRLYDARQYRDAIDQLEFALEMHPEMLPALLFLGRSQRLAGDLGRAIETFEKAVAISNGGPTFKAALASALATAGQRQEADALLGELITRSESEYVSSYLVALVLITLERFDESFLWLDRALREAEPSVIRATIDPELDPIRADLRFAGFLQQTRTPFED